MDERAESEVMIQTPCPESSCCQMRKRKNAQVGHESPKQKWRRLGSWLLLLLAGEGVAIARVNHDICVHCSDEPRT